MRKLLHEEVYDSKKPLLLIVSNNTLLQEALFDELSSKLSILFVGNPIPKKDSSNIYHIKPSDLHLLPHLSEKISYAVIHLSTIQEKEYLETTFKKLKQDRAKSLILIPANNYESFSDVLLHINSEANIIPALYGTILEENTSDNELLKIIRIALRKGTIRLSGKDLSPIFPISKRDFLTGIKQLLFSRKPKGLYYLFYKAPETLLSAIHLLHRIEPDIDLEINHEHPIQRFVERSTMTQNLKNKLQVKIYHLDYHLKGFLYAVEHLGVSTIKAPSYKKTKRKKRTPPSFSFLKFTPSISLALFSGLILFIMINIIFGIAGFLFLRSSIHAFENNDFVKAKNHGVLAKRVLSVPLPTLLVTESALSYFPSLKNTAETLHLVTTTVELTTSSSSLIEKLDTVSAGIEKEAFENILLDSQHLYHVGSRILLGQENQTISNILTPQTTKILSLLPVAPTILGYNGEKEYLLLFMNNAELRPTGGFIGSIGRLIVEEGRVKDFKIQDVYELDGQLTRHIEPHYIVRRNLQPHLYLRDSNFDLDFERSASMSARIYNLESGNTPDGVIAVDFTIIQRILGITGPIKLRNYDFTITSDNSMEFLQKTIEEDFFPGSTQKRDVLNELMTSITLEMEKNPEYFISTAFLLPELLDEKHILLSYQAEEIQKLLSALHYTGTIPDRKEQNDEKIYDTLGFNEANIGTNKANKDVSRSITYKADLTTRLSTANLTLRNTSKTDDYKTYLRLIVPQNSIFQEVALNGKEQKTISAIQDPKIYELANFSPDPNSLEIETTDDYQKTIFGTVVTIPKGEIVTISFTYTNPTLFLDDKKNTYSLTLIKQPGTQTTPTNIDLLFPPAYLPKGESIRSFGDGIVTLEDDLKTDTILTTAFIKG